jgi:glycosyltransferase involved in cell wall biosynthesis
MEMNPSAETWVIIPAYNESQVIGQVLTDLCPCPYHFVVVDDGSQDATPEIVRQYPVTLLRHLTNLGQGAALQTGISYALSFPSTRYLVTFDADGQHHPEDIRRMLKACQEGNYDVALGSRFIAGGRAANIRAVKQIGLKLAIALTRLTTGLNLSDTHNGLRVFTRQAATRIKITQNGMAHATEILNEIARLKLRYVEVPVSILYSAYSVSKGQSLWNGINILWDILFGKIR